MEYLYYRYMALPSSIFSALATIFVLFTAQAHALMAGGSPDSPAARIDPNTTTSSWAGVGSLSVGTGTYTATLIAPNYILTAAHVVAGATLDSVTFNLNFGGDLTQRIGAAEIFIHPDYHGFNSPNLNDDLAIIRLASPVPTGVPIYGLHHDLLATGTTLTFVGYGASGMGNIGTTVPANPAVKRTGQNNADQFALDDEGSGKAEVYYFDFDGPKGTSNLVGGNTLGNTLETTVSGGDSGSPAFIRSSDGNWQLAGINTFTFTHMAGQTTSTFGTGGGGMLVSTYAPWIGNIVTPVPEPASYALMLTGICMVSVVAFRVSTATSAR